MAYGYVLGVEILQRASGIFKDIWVFPKIWDFNETSILIGILKTGIFNRDFPYKPSILGYHYFWKHPYGALWLANI